MKQLNIIDIVLIIILAIGIINGFRSGFIKQIAALGGLVLGIVAAHFFSDKVEAFLRTVIDMTPYLYHPIAYFITFITVVFTCRLLAVILEKITSFVALGGINRLLGMLFGTMKYLLFLSILINLLSYIDVNSTLLDRETKDNSYFYNKIKAVAPFVFPYFKNEFKFDFKKKDHSDNKEQSFVVKLYKYKSVETYHARESRYYIK